ncbi:hypothetical protein WEH80_00610 [Actinomycetes bacterium KLBMP 9759]
MDPVVVALVSVIVSAFTAGIAAWSVHKNASLAREQRVEQRAADAYLQVLKLAEQEGQWTDATVYNYGLDWEHLRYGAVERIDVPRPAVTDKATASALIAAYGSSAVRSCHAEWRAAADALIELLDNISIGWALAGDPEPKVDPAEMKRLTDDLQPKERTARQKFGEAVASELRHR